MIEDLATLILEAQRIREESWDESCLKEPE